MKNIIPMTENYAKQISNWKYDGEYSFYDQKEEYIEEYLDGSHHACINEDGELIGYFLFGKNAQIPTVENYVYDGDFLDIGLGLAPNLCGKQMGLSFFNSGLDFARKTFGTTHFRLSVAVFNERAIKVYKKAGFTIEQEVTNSYFNNKFIIMKYIR